MRKTLVALACLLLTASGVFAAGSTPVPPTFFGMDWNNVANVPGTDIPNTNFGAIRLSASGGTSWEEREMSHIFLNPLFNPTGGVAPYSYSAATLPPGLTLSSAGMLTGTRTTAASMNFLVTISDSEASH